MKVPLCPVPVTPFADGTTFPVLTGVGSMLPDLVVTSMELSKELRSDGFELLLSDIPGVGIIVLTGDEDEMWRVTGWL